MENFILNNYRVQSNGADGGVYYIVAKIQFNGIYRSIAVLFKDKYAVKGIDESKEITVQGELIDEGKNQDLLLNNSTILSK